MGEKTQKLNETEWSWEPDPEKIYILAIKDTIGTTGWNVNRVQNLNYVNIIETQFKFLDFAYYSLVM